MATQNRTFSLIQLITQADPDFNIDRRRQLEYVFGKGREFYGITDERGPYAADMQDDA